MPAAGIVAGLDREAVIFSRLFHTAYPIIQRKRGIVVRIHTALLAGLSILFVRGSVHAQDSPADRKPTTTSEEHFGLGQYFDELALQEQRWAQSYKRLASLYREKEPPLGLDATSTGEVRKQYTRLAEIDSKAAKAIEDLAAYHRRQAERMDNVSLAPREGPTGTFSSVGR